MRIHASMLHNSYIIHTISSRSFPLPILFLHYGINLNLFSTEDLSFLSIIIFLGMLLQLCFRVKLLME